MLSNIIDKGIVDIIQIHYSSEISTTNIINRIKCMY